MREISGCLYVGGNKADGKSDEAGVRGELLETRPGVGRRGWDLGGRFFFSYKYGQSIDDNKEQPGHVEHVLEKMYVW